MTYYYLRYLLLCSTLSRETIKLYSINTPAFLYRFTSVTVQIYFIKFRLY